MSEMSGIKYNKNHVNLGLIGNFFGPRMGLYRDERLFQSLGITNVPGKNKSEKVANVDQSIVLAISHHAFYDLLKPYFRNSTAPAM